MKVVARLRYISVPNEIGLSYNDNKQYSQCLLLWKPLLTHRRSRSGLWVWSRFGNRYHTGPAGTSGLVWRPAGPKERMSGSQCLYQSVRSFGNSASQLVIPSNPTEGQNVASGTVNRMLRRISYAVREQNFMNNRETGWDCK